MLVVYALLISLCLMGMVSLFLFKDHIRKILALSISYSSFLFLIILLSLQSNKQSEALTIVITILIIFAINLLVAAGLVRNVSKKY